MAGKPLTAYLDKGLKTELRRVRDIIGQLLDALAYSHAQGVIEPDVGVGAGAGAGLPFTPPAAAILAIASSVVSAPEIDVAESGMPPPQAVSTLANRSAKLAGILSAGGLLVLIGSLEKSSYTPTGRVGNAVVPSAWTAFETAALNFISATGRWA